MKATRKKLLSILLSLTLILTLVPVFGTTARARENSTSYTLTIPSTLTVANSGWNATDGIAATGSLESGKKLTVTASSVNGWALKSGGNSVGYNLATESGTYSSSAAPATWAFPALSSTATTQPMGIIVEDYSSKPAGTYQDTVTFTARIENAVYVLSITSPAVGQVIGDDGKNYTPDAVPSGITKVAMIAYVNGSNGLAVALSDENNDMGFATAKTTAAAHTPVFSGGTWRLPTLDDWKNILTGCGDEVNDSYVNDGNNFSAGNFQDKLNTAGGTLSGGFSYWIDEVNTNNATFHWCFETYSNSNDICFGSWGHPSVEKKVRAVLAF